MQVHPVGPCLILFTAGEGVGYSLRRPLTVRGSHLSYTYDRLIESSPGGISNPVLQVNSPGLRKAKQFAPGHIDLQAAEPGLERQPSDCKHQGHE